MQDHIVEIVFSIFKRSEYSLIVSWGVCQTNKPILAPAQYENQNEH